MIELFAVLWAKGVGDKVIQYVKECFMSKSPVDESINNLFLSYFKEYTLVGGMPETIEAYINEKKFI